MQLAHPFPASDTEKHHEERALVERILSSPTFKKSPRLRAFLQYISDRALNGHSDEIHEQFIGHHVFKRPIDYNPIDDNIVRVSARHLRMKLREYFETDGLEERWRVEIPKGGYLPVFRERGPQDVLVEEVKAKAQTRRLRLIRHWSITLAAVVFTLILNDWYLSRSRVTPTRTHPTPSGNFVMDLFAASPGPVQVVLSDSALVLMEKLVGHKVDLSRYADRTYLALPRELTGTHRMRLLWNFLATRQLSSIGNQEAAERFLVSMSGHGASVTIRNARNMRTRDFMSGNFVLLGSSYSNPWASLFSKGLNFRSALERPGGSSEIRNLRPSAGEQKVYSLKGRRGVKEVSYAHVAFGPNLTNSGRVLLVGGISMAATEATADFLLNPSVARKLQPVLRTQNSRHIPNFELLLKISALDGTPKSICVVSYRVHGSFASHTN